jgi:hypothetical protein
MAELLCTVHFKYSNENIPEEIKKVLEKYFMCGRDIIVGMLNPHYEEWNALYNKEVTGEDDMEYNEYIQTKQQAIIDRFNRMAKNSFHTAVEFYSDEYADIAAKFKYNEEIVTMHMGIKLLNEEEWRASNN